MDWSSKSLARFGSWGLSGMATNAALPQESIQETREDCKPLQDPELRSLHDRWLLTNTANTVDNSRKACEERHEHD